MNLRRIAFLGLALVAGSLAALPAVHAADLPARAPTMPTFQAIEQLPNWTGFYVGLTAGGAFADKGRARVAYEDGSAFPGSVSSRTSSGFTVGGTLGYNQQFGSFVAGVEGDYSYLGLSSRTRANYSFETGSPLLPSTYQANGSVRSKIDSFGTVRGRIGYLVTPSLLVYGTGGVAFADVSTRASVSEGLSFGDGSSMPFATYTGRRSGLKTGFAYGGGAEYKIDPSWSVKVEALRVQLPESRVFAGNDSGFGYGFRRIKNDFTVVRAGLNYSFNTF